MQTFLPLEAFKETASVLDYRRLGKQRLEGQDCEILCTGIKPDWMSEKQFNYLMRRYKNGPVVRMWKDYEEALRLYVNCIIEEWVKRGYRNNLFKYKIDYDKLIYPPWLGNEKLHSSHRAALLFKNYEWYSQFGWLEKPEINYYWEK